jgi:hypothetical protein
VINIKEDNVNRFRIFVKGAEALALLLAVFIAAGGASVAAVSPQAAVSLVYQFPEGRTLSYRTTGGQTQNMDMMGQTMTTESVSATDFTVKGVGMKDGNLVLNVTIDAATADVSSPQGNMSPDMSVIVGKAFDMVVSKLGKEIDVSGAEAIKYDMPMGGTRDLSSGFQAFFSDLPDKPVKVGDTWPSEDTIVQKEGMGETRISFKNLNTFDGIETVDGYECARVKAAVQGTITGNLEQQGMGISIDMKLDGTDTWYFAIKEGIYVKSDMKAAMGGVVVVGEPANMTIPVSGETRQSASLIKK